MPDVFEYTGDNPPGLDVLAKHDTVVWKHPQHGWLRVQKGGGFVPIGEAEVQRLKAAVPAPTVATSPAGGRGAGTTRLNVGGRPTTAYEVAELKRAKKEGEVQSALTRAQFQPGERKDPMEGMGPAERAEVARMVREGKTQEEAIAEVRRKRKPAAATQAGALK